MSRGITLVVADDHAVMRDAVCSLIGREPDMRVVAQANSGPGAAARCRELRADVVVIDLSMPGGGGLDSIGSIRQSSPATRVLVLSMHDSPGHARAALAAGASAYVVKRAGAGELLKTIREVCAGAVNLRVGLSEGSAVTAPAPLPSHPEPPPRELLSHRELEVLKLLAAGFGNKAIAADLGLSPKSVATYCARLREKLGLKGRAGLVRYALRHGLAAISGPG